MKKILALFVFGCVASLSYGQITWDQAIADTARGFESNPDIETHNVVTFANPGTYRWVRSYKENCKIKTAICDKNSCYLETTDSADFTVTANESFDMICHFYPYDSCCPEGAMVSLYVYKIDEPSVNSTATYYLDLWCESLSASYTTTAQFILAPNPVTDKVQLMNTPANLESITVLNILGETVATSSINASSINVASLKSGMYWVAIKSAGVTYTQRFIKQ
ncbi:MAG: T9SS type A sorting domain-containing protein [Bacteroidetes bacterium]|jgi:hypothetical protein|nr:T9SS type A sorting domain-containing protein [Bacteroidota bacterium]